MTKHFFNITRHEGGAFIEIFEIDRLGGGVKAGRKVTEYETSSVGATKSARKTIKQLELAK